MDFFSADNLERADSIVRSDSTFRLRGWAENKGGANTGPHKRFLIIEEVDAGDTAPIMQEALKELNAKKLWDAFNNDAKKAGMPSNGNKAGPGVEDLLK